VLAVKQLVAEVFPDALVQDCHKHLATDIQQCDASVVVWECWVTLLVQGNQLGSLPRHLNLA
jgi:hypothetical protein